MICLKKPASIKAIVISVEFVPETIYIKDVMNLLTKSAKAWQWSLTGGTSGIVTIEDIVEELLEDEHDSDEELIEGVGDDTYILMWVFEPNL
jgi:CBS domain containing-hemolysin-like protein